MNAIYKIIIFTFLVNVSSGLLLGITGWDVSFQNEVKDYDQINQSINPLKSDPSKNPSVSEGSTSIFEDFFGIEIFGWYTAIKNFLNSYLFGIVDIMLALPNLDTETHNIINNFLKIILSLMYGFGLILFITGRRID